MRLIIWIVLMAFVGYFFSPMQYEEEIKWLPIIISTFLGAVVGFIIGKVIDAL